MKLNFRQGIVSHQIDAFGAQTFLDLSGGYVSLLVNPEPTIITFTHGDREYLYTEKASVNNAWGPITPNVNQWLYWDINRATAERTFGITTLEPVVDHIAPTVPGIGQMWFDPARKKWFEYNGASWVEVIRALACLLQAGNTFISMSARTPDFRGTQVGTPVPYRSGAFAFDANGKPIRASNGFFTTEDVFTTGVSTGASLRVNNVLIPAAAGQPLHKYQVVMYDDLNTLIPADPYKQGRKLFGIIEEDAPTNEVVNFITEGLVFNADWDWIDDGLTANDPVFVDNTGMVITAPYFPGQQPLGVVVGRHEIMFSPRMFPQVTIADAAETFLDHPDTPTDYASNANMFIKVKADETGLEFTPAPVQLTNWGQISGTLANQTDLNIVLSGKSDDGHVHDITDVTGLQAALDGKVDAELNDLTAAVVWDTVPDAFILHTAVTQHEALLTITESQISDLGNYEPAFTKNSGFNLELGTTAGTVAEGNHLHVKADISDFSDADYATAAQGALASSALQDLSGSMLRDMSDVHSSMAPANGQVLTYNSTNSEWEAVTPTAVISDHTLLSNVGVNTHDQIDTHIADSSLHYTMASISITESQISDLQPYLTDLTSESIATLADVLDSMSPANGQVLMYNSISSLWEAQNPPAGVTDHTLLTNIGTNTHADIDLHMADTSLHLGDVPVGGDTYGRQNGSWVNITTDLDNASSHIADSSVHFDQASISITESQISDLQSYLIDAPSDGNDYVRNNGVWVIPTSSGVTDHTLLTNIGTNTHAQIDAHLATGSLHYTMASINITESQISDLQTYLTDAPSNGSEYVRKDGAWAVATGGGGGGVTDHTALTNIGTYTHAQIDTHILNGSIHFSDAPSDGNQYARENGGWTQVTGGGGSLVGIVDNATTAVLTISAADKVGIGAAPSGTYMLEVTGEAYVSSTLDVLGVADFFDTTTVDADFYVTGTMYMDGYSLPSTDGSNGQVLTTNGSGVVTWANAGGLTDHTTLLNIGTNSHAQIDTHIADSDIHYSDAPSDNQEYARKNGVWAVVTQSGVTDHTLLSNIGSNTHAQIDSHISNGTIHLSEAPSDGNEYVRKDGTWAVITATGVTDHTLLTNIGSNSHATIDAHLANSNVHYGDAPSDGNEYIRKDGAWAVITATGVTDHTLLSNIGTYTHANIDTHINDASKHFTMASISITESQISDLGSYLTDAPSDGSQYVRKDGAWSAIAGGAGIADIVEDTTPQLGGDLDLNGHNITGEFTAAPGTRDAFVTKTADSFTVVTAIPNGTSDEAYFAAEGSNTSTDAPFVSFGVNGSESAINSSKRGTGTALPFIIRIDAATALTINTDLSTSFENLTLHKELASSPGTPASGYGSLYAKTDGSLYYKNDGGVEFDLTTGAGGGINNVADDTTPQLGGDLDGAGYSIINSPLATNAQTGTTYTTLVTDADKLITLDNASAITVTIPSNASVAYPVGTKLNFMQLGAGDVTVTVDTDTLNVDDSFTTTLGGQYASATALKIGTTSWVLLGNLETTGSGGSGISDIVEDTSPQLGGDLDLNGNSIVTPGAATTITAKPGTGTGAYFILSGGTDPDNSNRLVMGATTTSSYISSTPLGTGSTEPLDIYVGSDRVMRYGTDWSMILKEQTVANTATPSGYGKFYVKTDGKLYFKNDSETEYDLTASGSGGINNVIEDTTPQLGGALDLNGNDITSTGFNVDTTNQTVLIKGPNFPPLKVTREGGAAVLSTPFIVSTEHPTGAPEDQFGTGMNFACSDNTGTSISTSRINSIVDGTDGNTKFTFEISSAGSLSEVLSIASGEIDAKGNSIINNPVPTNAQTGTTYTTVLTDADKLITLDNAADITVTIPANGTTAYPVGTKLNFMQLGAGQVTINVDTDTLHVDAAFTNKTNDQYAMAAAVKLTATSWVLMGNLESTGGGAGGLANVVEDTTPELGGNLDAQGNNITNVGQLEVSSATFPPANIIRESDTLGGVSALQVKAKSSIDMVDTYGTSITFSIEDDAAVENYIGYITTTRDGADNTGVMELGVYNAGSATANLTLSSDGSTQLEGNLKSNGNSIEDATLESFGESFETPTSSSGSITFDMANTNFFAVTLTENITSITFSNVPTGKVIPITVEFTQDGTGGHTVTGWPAGTTWSGGTEPVITSTANAMDLIAGYTRDGGTTIRLDRAMENSS